MAGEGFHKIDRITVGIGIDRAVQSIFASCPGVKDEAANQLILRRLE